MLVFFRAVLVAVAVVVPVTELEEVVVALAGLG